MVAGIATPPEESLRQKLQEVLSRPEFQHTTSEQSESDLLWWLSTLLRWVMGPLRWLYSMTEGLPEIFRWLIVAILVVALATLMVHILWTLRRAMGGGDRIIRGRSHSANGEQAQLSVAELEKAAERNAVSGAFIEAVRLLFRAMLMRLEEREGRRFRRGITNRQHLRRYHGSPFASSIRMLVNTIEKKWYGEEACDQTDFEECRQAYSEICLSLQAATSAKPGEKC